MKMKISDKKIGVIILIIAVLTALCLNVGFTALAEDQRVFGRICERGYDYVIIETDTGFIEATDTVNAGLGVYGWFTLNENAEILAFEELVDYEWEIGYFTTAGRHIFGEFEITIVTDKETVFSTNSSLYIDGVRYTGISSNSNKVEDALKNCLGIVKFKAYGNTINSISSIAPIYSAKGAKFNRGINKFTGCGYTVTDKTLIYDTNIESELNVLSLSDIKEGFSYDIEVFSYDRDYNARAIVITEPYKNDVGFYYHSYSYFGAVLTMADNQGTTKNVPLSDEVILDARRYYYEDVLRALSDYHGVIEYKINAAGDIIEINTIAPSGRFTDLVYDEETKKLGEYDTEAVKVYTMEDMKNNLNHEYNDTSHIWTNEVLSERYVYSGDIFTLSDGSTALWAKEKNQISGNISVAYTYNAYLYSDDNIFVSAQVDINGYQGNAMVYIGVYKDDNLCEIRTYYLEDEISERIYIEGLTAENKDEYSVVGFIWDESLAPISDKTTVQIR